MKNYRSLSKLERQHVMTIASNHTPPQNPDDMEEFLDAIAHYQQINLGQDNSLTKEKFRHPKAEAYIQYKLKSGNLKLPL